MNENKNKNSQMPEQNKNRHEDADLARAKEQLAPKTIENAPSPGGEQAP